MAEELNPMNVHPGIPATSEVSAYWIIPGACFGLSAVTALFMKYRDHMLKLKSNAENLETWTDLNEIEELKSLIQERGKLCSLTRAELDQALQQEEQSVEELQWLIRDTDRQKELERDALNQRGANERIKNKLDLAKKELAWWKERAKQLRENSLTVAETEASKSAAEAMLQDKEREMMKKKHALHEIRRKRWEKPFRAITSLEKESGSSDGFSAAIKCLSTSTSPSMSSSTSSAPWSSSGANVAGESLRRVVRRLSGTEVMLEPEAPQEVTFEPGNKDTDTVVSAVDAVDSDPVVSGIYPPRDVLSTRGSTTAESCCSSSSEEELAQLD
ncbi:unnamed protein product [Notodromas monacha]|uniref:Uncharacterized protein n=1 Tax=Notodromas monacha TaxID=399045 RepID=A0A7R9BXJ3_9CRUS|nr:unnamed protein product [Notodromas monacha]CAG0923552.1 unnamed protein product [Notodromas monacha]